MNEKEQKHRNLDAAELVKNEAAKAKGLMNEFKDFLKEYKIVGIAAGLVIGQAVTSLTTSIVAGLITPLIQLLIPFDSWKSLAFTVNGVVFHVGVVVTALINFLVIALLFFLFVKFLMKKEKVTKDILS